MSTQTTEHAFESHVEATLAATAAERARAKAWEAEIAKRRYAVIIDEAHSSQTGETARELKAILGAGPAGGGMARRRPAAGTVTAEDPAGEPDWEDRLNEVLASRGRQPNLSFFAFTATPKGEDAEAVRPPRRPRRSRTPSTGSRSASGA